MNGQELIDNASDAPPSGGKVKRKRGNSRDRVEEGSKKKNQEESSQPRCPSSSGASGGGGPTSKGPGIRKKRARRPRRRHRQRTNSKRGSHEEGSKTSDGKDEPTVTPGGEATTNNQRQRQRMGSGRAMAPRNTTQFLLDDRIARNQEPDGGEGSVDGMRGSRERTFSGTGSMDGSDWSFSDAGEGGSGDEDSSSNSFEREFEAEYESVHTERLEAMSKNELIRDYVNLEGQMQRSRVEWREMVEVVERLRDENYKLRRKLCESGLLPRPASAPPPLPTIYSSPDQPMSPEKIVEAEEETPADPLSLP